VAIKKGEKINLLLSNKNNYYNSNSSVLKICVRQNSTKPLWSNRLVVTGKPTNFLKNDSVLKTRKRLMETVSV
jgi:hypothetical protein